jgi:hypothetical protein
MPPELGIRDRHQFSYIPAGFGERNERSAFFFTLEARGSPSLFACRWDLEIRLGARR